MTLPTENAHWVVVPTIAAVAGLVLTRIGRSLLPRMGLLDRPDGRRKIQTRPVPVAGGVAVYCATLLAVLVAAIISPDIRNALTADPFKSLALVAAATVITLVGLLDDRVNLRARYKLLGQIAAASILIGPGGFLISNVTALGGTASLGPMAIPLTLLWLLTCTNALNLLDGMDGLLGTVGLIALLTLATLAGMSGHLFPAIVALSLAGAVLGFLWYNLPPASVYMGDGGSMLIGLVIGAVAIPASLKGPATVALLAPVAILVLPMADTTAAVIRRRLTGRGLAVTDHGHLHHVLQRHGLTVRRVLVLVAVLGLIASGGALASITLHNDIFALVAAGGVVITLVATRLFGHSELVLVRKRIVAALQALRSGEASWELAVRLQGTADWEEVWRDMTGCAEQLNLQTIRLDVNAPMLREDYHARWDRAEQSAPETHLWRVEMPLFANSQAIGRLAVTGCRDEEPLLETLATLAKIIETAEVQVCEATTPAAPMKEPRPLPTAFRPVASTTSS